MIYRYILVLKYCHFALIMDKAEFNKLFGEYLKSVRTEQGLTQLDLASIMNVNPQNISAIERGEVSPTLFWIHKLSAALNINTGDFISQFYLNNF